MKRSLRNKENRVIRARQRGGYLLVGEEATCRCEQKGFKQKFMGICLGPKQRRNS